MPNKSALLLYHYIRHLSST